jgi:protein-disulfide isomerase
MGRKRSFIQILVLATALIAALLIAGGAVYEASATPGTRVMLVEGRPRIGRMEAKVELVLIEDLRCGACRFFTEKVFPHIEREYIETGKAYCIMVPVSFLEGSKPLANAALAVYQIAPDRFLSYLHALFEHFNGRSSNGYESKALIDLAEKVGGIDLNQLRECIDSNCFALQLEQNLDWAKRIMGRDFGTPALYINGMKTSPSLEKIKERIERLQ